MNYDKQYYLIDDVIRPENANRWEDGIADLFAVATCSISGTTITLNSQWSPLNTTDYWIEFVATAAFPNNGVIVANGTTIAAANVLDQQGRKLQAGAWASGAPVRIRILNGRAYLMGGAIDISRIDTVESTLTSHVNNRNNPHNVTAAQVGSPTTAQFNTLNSAVSTLQTNLGTTNSTLSTLSTRVTTNQTTMTNHINARNNPHGVTAAQVGAPTSANFSNLQSTVSSNQTTMNSHINNRSNPHNVTAAQVGAPTTSAFNTLNTAATNHIANRSNPHVVTTGQINALSTTQTSTQSVASRVDFGSLVSIAGTLQANSALTVAGAATFNNGSIRIVNGTSSLTVEAGSGRANYDVSGGAHYFRSNTGAGGFCFATEFVNQSDRSLKSNIEEVPAELVDEFLKVSPHSYEMQGNESIGYIADELPEELVSDVEDNTQGVKLYALVAMQGAAIKRLSAQIEQLNKERENNA